MASNQSNDSCLMPDWFWIAQDVVYFFGNIILPPFQLTIGLFGNVLGFVVFAKQARKDAAFTFQAAMRANETVHILVNAMTAITFRGLCGYTSEGATWFMRSHALMWYVTHVTLPLVNALHTAMILISVLMAGERFLVIRNPTKYAIEQHRVRRQLAMLIGAYVIGTLTSLVDIHRYEMYWDGDLLRLLINTEYLGSSLALFSDRLRESVRFLGLILLIVCNVLAVRMFRKKLVFHSKSRKDAEKTLFVLCLSQSALITISMSILIIYLQIVFENPEFTNCGGLLMGPCMEAIISFHLLIDFSVLLIVSKPFRLMVFEQLSCRRPARVAVSTVSDRIGAV